MASSLKESFSGLGNELLDGIRDMSNTKLDEAAFEERVIGIEKATAAFCEEEIRDEKIIYYLQKYWDLRRSEAEMYLKKERHMDEN